MPASSRLSFRSTLIVGLLLLAACSRTPRQGDFTPPADRAQKSLEAALSQWKAGGAPGTVADATPPVQVVDSKWKAGQKLKDYEILGEDSQGSDGSAPRFFKVRLTTTKGPPQEVRYVIVGIDPIWVYREEDYKALSEMGK